MRVLIALGGLLAATNAALAADVPYGPPPAPPQVYAPQPYYAPPPPPPPFSWSGVYIGTNGGGGFANGTANVSIAGGLLDGSTATSSARLTGGIAGGQIGGNYQFGAFVLGVEGDMQWSGQTNTTISSCGFGCSV